MTTLTKTGIDINEFRAWKETRLDPETEEFVTTWYASAGYRVITAEGETWNRELSEEITGPIKTKASALLTAIRAYILTHKEGL